MNMDLRPKTIFCDIDGTLIEHCMPSASTSLTYEIKPLPGTLEKLSEWDRNGYNIILTTGRRESMRSATEAQLAKAGIFYDQLIMGIGSGCRYIINDIKTDGTRTAYAINLERNKGIDSIQL